MHGPASAGATMSASDVIGDVADLLLELAARRRGRRSSPRAARRRRGGGRAAPRAAATRRRARRPRRRRRRRRSAAPSSSASGSSRRVTSAPAAVSASQVSSVRSPAPSRRYAGRHRSPAYPPSTEACAVRGDGRHCPQVLGPCDSPAARSPRLSAVAAAGRCRGGSDTVGLAALADRRATGRRSGRARRARAPCSFHGCLAGGMRPHARSARVAAGRRGGSAARFAPHLFPLDERRAVRALHGSQTRRTSTVARARPNLGASSPSREPLLPTRTSRSAYHGRAGTLVMSFTR